MMAKLRNHGRRLGGMAAAAALLLTAASCTQQQLDNLEDTVNRMHEARLARQAAYERQRQAYAQQPEQQPQEPGRVIYSQPRAEPRGRSCPQKFPGSFLDIGRGECWSCPPGQKRTIFPVDGQKACEDTSPAQYVKADGPRRPFGLIGTDCDRGWFLDIGKGRCYYCPSGTHRTIFPVDSLKACERRALLLWGRATLRGIPG